MRKIIDSEADYLTLSPVDQAIVDQRTEKFEEMGFDEDDLEYEALRDNFIAGRLTEKQVWAIYLGQMLLKDALAQKQQTNNQEDPKEQAKQARLNEWNQARFNQQHPYYKSLKEAYVEKNRGKLKTIRKIFSGEIKLDQNLKAQFGLSSQS